MTIDLDNLERLARDVVCLDGRMSGARVVAVGRLNAALDPSAVLELVRRLRAAEVMSRDHDDARALIDPAKAVVDALRMYVRLDTKGLDPNMSSVLEKLDKYERAEEQRPPLSGATAAARGR